jgi:hypothetical protein
MNDHFQRLLSSETNEWSLPKAFIDIVGWHTRNNINHNVYFPVLKNKRHSKFICEVKLSKIWSRL